MLEIVLVGVFEEDMTYSRSVVGSAVEDVSGQRILGTPWNYHNDNLVFDFTNTAALAKTVEPTKRNVISTASKMYDPLGMIHSVAILIPQIVMVIKSTSLAQINGFSSIRPVQIKFSHF